MRAAHRVCRTVVLRLRFADSSRATRSHTLPESTASTQVVLTVGRDLLAAAMPIIEKQGITLLGLTLSNLDDENAIQLTLPFGQAPAGSLDATLDDLRTRYGATAVTRAVLLGQDQGIQVPLLPD